MHYAPNYIAAQEERAEAGLFALRTACQQCEPATAATTTTSNKPAPPEFVRRAGYTWGAAVGPVARDRGNWAATLRRPPRESRLPGAASARRKDCRPRGLDALMQAQRGSFAFFAPFNS